tara:strand:+ start:138 stop:272 length:135 start_codon:yes stop_codon:yes gene_type:complete
MSKLTDFKDAITEYILQGDEPLHPQTIHYLAKILTTIEAMEEEE